MEYFNSSEIQLKFQKSFSIIYNNLKKSHIRNEWRHEIEKIVLLKVSTVFPNLHWTYISNNKLMKNWTFNTKWSQQDQLHIDTNMKHENIQHENIQHEMPFFEMKYSQNNHSWQFKVLIFHDIQHLDYWNTKILLNDITIKMGLTWRS